MNNDRMRISDADRERVAERLREHYAEGRLSSDELEERITTTLSAKTYGDLSQVLADLPEPAPAPPYSQPGAAAPWGQRRTVVYRRGPRLLPLALIALAAALVLPGVGFVFLVFFKLLLLLFLATAVAGVFAAFRFRRHVRRTWQSGSPWQQFQGRG